MSDLISRAAAIDDLHGKDPSQIWDTADIEVWVNALPPAQLTEVDIQRMQDIEQAMLDKAYECGKQDAAQWIPCSERLPKKPNVYTVTDSNNRVVRFAFTGTDSSREYWKRCAKAWMPLPEPYREVSE